MAVSIVTSLADFHALKASWNALYEADFEAQIFLSHAWLSDLFNRRPGVCVLLYFSDADGTITTPVESGTNSNPPYLIAAFPLRPVLNLDRKKRRFRQDILLAGNHWADRTGILCRPGCERQAIPALAQSLDLLSWERLQLLDLPDDHARYDRLIEFFDNENFKRREWKPTDNNGLTSLDTAPKIVLPHRFEDWLDQSIGRNTRQKIRRYTRKFEQSAELGFRISTSDTYKRDITAFRHLWLARWSESKRSRATALADKYQRILLDGFESKHLQLLVMEENGKAVAVHALYDDPVSSTVSFFAGARDTAFSTLPAGLILHARAIESAIKDGRRFYDLLRGDEPYKYQLGGIDNALRTLEIRRTPPQIKDVFLQHAYRDQALQMVAEIHDSASERTVGKLYSQLLEAWPNDSVVLSAFENWSAGN